MYSSSNTPARSGRLSRPSLKALACLLISFTFVLIACGEADAGAQRRRAKRPRATRVHQSGVKPSHAADTSVAHPKRFRPGREGFGALEGVSGEDPDGRSDWFYFKRAYPSGRLPADARRRAWESRPAKAKVAGALSAQEQIWSPVGPAPTRPEFINNWGVTSGRINAVAVSPADPRVVLVGASTGGVWRSADGGETFAPASDDQVDLAVGAIAFAPSDPSVVYAGMGDLDNGYVGTGVLKSTNGGLTWSRVSNDSLPARGLVNDIAVDPSDPNRVYVAQVARLDASLNTLFEAGFFFSADGGTSWTKTLGGNARNIAIHPANPQTLYLAMRTAVNDSTGGIYKTTNGGLTWSKVYTSPYTLLTTRDIRVAVTPSDPQRVYVYVGRTTGGVEARLEMSKDAGATWTARGKTCVDAGQFGYNTYLYASPAAPDTLYAGARDIFKSTDGGLTWTNLTKSYTPPFSDPCSFSYSPQKSKAHPDQQSFAFSPDNPNVFYAGNDGGLYKSEDAGQSFRSLNPTLSLTQFVHLSLHPTDPSVSYGGSQDNGTQRHVPGGSLWDEFSGGDGGRSVLDPVDPAIVYPTYVRGTLFRRPASGGTEGLDYIAFEETFGEDSPPRIGFYPPFVGNGADHKLYFGSWRLFVCADCHDPARSAFGQTPATTTTWTAPGGSLDLTKGGSDVLNAVAVARSDTNVVYTGSVQGRAMVSIDGGAHWADVTAGLPNRVIESITVAANAPSVAYLTVSGYGSGHVFRTTNAGASWADVSGNLPDVPVNCFLFDPLRPTTVYVGTDVGVFRSTGGGGTWETFNSGMPPVIVTALASQPLGLIQAATYGRGVYEYVRPAPAPANVSFTAATAAAAETDGRVRLTVARTDTAGAASVDYATSDATASERTDYTTARGTLRFAAGEATRTLDVLITDDAFAEPAKVFTVALSNPSNLIVTEPSAAAVTVTDNDAATRQSPVRWAPGFDSRFFVRQHYLDFLGREPDQSGWDFWTAEIENCGTDNLCREVKRVNVSAAFFLSIEFQESGYLVYKAYKVSFGNLQGKPVPVTFQQLSGDSRRIAREVVVGHGDWQTQLEANKQEFFNGWVSRPEFAARYPQGMSTAEFVDALNANAGGPLTPSRRAALVGQLTTNNTSWGRALVLRQVAEDPELSRLEKNRAFVLMQYYGYLRRNPDAPPNSDFSGYQFWLSKLEQFGGNYVDAEMVKAFLTSEEYCGRFGQ
jgi:photosystem II stability/assembly factor-like uncharacterized protein